jgi:hypothetical protein
MLKILALFNKMPAHWYVSVSISNESGGSATELVRYGLSWERFIRNFKIYYQHSKVGALLIAPTLSIFTIKTFPDFIKTMIEIVIELGNSKSFKIIGNWILFPEILNPVYAKAEYKSSINDLKNFVISSGVIRNANFVTFLEKLEHRIGSLELDHNRLDEFLEELVEQKSDNNIWKLKDLL